MLLIAIITMKALMTTTAMITTARIRIRSTSMRFTARTAGIRPLTVTATAGQTITIAGGMGRRSTTTHGRLLPGILPTGAHPDTAIMAITTTTAVGLMGIIMEITTITTGLVVIMDRVAAPEQVL